MVHYESAIASLSIAIGHDASLFDPDGPLPPLPESNASKSGQQRVIELAARENLTVRQLAQRLGGYAGLSFVGTPQFVADEMQNWLESEGSDGFNVMFPFVPEGLYDFVDLVVPELQKRGIFRREYEGRTLRENLGLPRPSNRFFLAIRFVLFDALLCLEAEKHMTCMPRLYLQPASGLLIDDAAVIQRLSAQLEASNTKRHANAARDAVGHLRIKSYSRATAGVTISSA